MAENEVSAKDRVKVYELCKAHLGGKWREVVNESQLLIRHVSGGFVNKLFYCFLSDENDGQYNRVVIRTVDFGDTLGAKLYSKINAMAINLYSSQKRISPKLLSIFRNGTISEYIDFRYFNANDDHNLELVVTLAQTLAKFHSLDIPIVKRNGKSFAQKVIDYILADKNLLAYTSGAVYEEELRRQECHTLFIDNIEREVQWLSRVLIRVDSPVVLAHNDFNRRNILIQKTNDKNIWNILEKNIFLIDFDWSCYDYRGMDFGTYFSTWSQTDTDFGVGDYPDDEHMEVFIEAYIREMCAIVGPMYGERAVNTRQSLIKESKVFSLMSFMKDILYCIWMTAVANDTQLLIKADKRFQCYYKLKAKIFNEYGDI